MKKFFAALLFVACTSAFSAAYQEGIAWRATDTTITTVTPLTLHGIVIGGGSGHLGFPTVLAVPSSGTILTGVASSDPAFSATPTLGASGTLGTISFGNATSGTITLSPVTGALGTVTLSLPATTGTVALTSGNVATATALQTARAINGVNFDGTAAITVTAAAGTLTGTTLASNVVTSSITSVGTIATGVWNGTAVSDTYISSAATWNAKQSAITFGTGVQTALGVNVGSAGAPVLFNGAGGTPSGITLTNGTGLPIAGLTASTSTALGVGSIELGHATDTTLSRSSAGVLAVEGVVIPSISSTNTFTNKRITKRITTLSSSATPAINTDNCDQVNLTLSTNVTSFTSSLSGTPSDGDVFFLRITPDSTPRTLSFGASFRAMVALPTTTTASKIMYAAFKWSAADSVWDCMATVTQP